VKSLVYASAVFSPNPLEVVMRKFVLIALASVLTSGCAAGIIGSFAAVDVIENVVDTKKKDDSRVSQQGVEQWREICKFNPVNELCPQLNERSGNNGPSFFYVPK
jgi:hypothetical protein